MYVAGFKLPGVYANIRDGFVHSFIQDTAAEGLFCQSGDQPRTTASSAPRGWGGWEAWSEVGMIKFISLQKNPKSVSPHLSAATPPAFPGAWASGGGSGSAGTGRARRAAGRSFCRY